MEPRGEGKNVAHVSPNASFKDTQHVYITGGSQGLGLALAKDLAKKGASISIVARTQSKLDAALKELEVRRSTIRLGYGY